LSVIGEPHLRVAEFATEGDEHRRVFFASSQQPRFFAWDFDVFAARWTGLDGGRNRDVIQSVFQRRAWPK
jgi:hypothetical protein